MKGLDLLTQIKAMGLPAPEQEYRFHDTRRWRADLCWPDEKLIVEIEGGAYVRGRHTRGKGFEADIIKYNTAVLMGYRLLRFTPGQIKNGIAVEMIDRALND